MLVVLGWDNAWNESYASLIDSHQNIFSDNHLDICAENKERVVDELLKTVDFDGAILIDKKGRILGSGMNLENMKPKEAAALIGQNCGNDLSDIFGFSKKVHTRHLNAIAASYRLRGSTVYVISEEDGSIRIFEGGKIAWSYPHESEWRRT